VVPAETTPEGATSATKRGDKVLFWRVFWSLAALEALALAWWFRERLVEQPVGTLLMITLIPVLILGHVNVFPASLAARLWRHRHRNDPPS
jgi:hypothetical protein